LRGGEASLLLRRAVEELVERETARPADRWLDRVRRGLLCYILTSIALEVVALVLLLFTVEEPGRRRHAPALS
jgi:hypothetical protein